ncbi:MAG: TSUP family transporter [Bdellovibrionales bacterium]
MNQIFMSLGIGLTAGILSGLFGIGGGIIVVPLLVLLWGYPQQLASATSLIIFLLPIGLAGVWKYYSMGVLKPEQFKLGLMIGLGVMLGSYFGAQLSSYLSGAYLQKGFSLLLFFVALQLWFKS